MSNKPAPSSTVDFYWRPGCPFCMMLERSLKKKKIPFTKKNIWDDPAYAATVRSVANGNETVPTVVVGSRFMVNPSGKDVEVAVRAELPQLLR